MLHRWKVRCTGGKFCWTGGKFCCSGGKFCCTGGKFCCTGGKVLLLRWQVLLHRWKVCCTGGTFCYTDGKFCCTFLHTVCNFTNNLYYFVARQFGLYKWSPLFVSSTGSAKIVPFWRIRGIKNGTAFYLAHCIDSFAGLNSKLFLRRASPGKVQESYLIPIIWADVVLLKLRHQRCM